MTMSLRQLAYVDGLKEFVVLALMKPQKLCHRLTDPFENQPVVEDLEKEIEKRLASTTDEERPKLESLLHLVQTYNESHCRFERLKYIAGNPDWLRRTNLSDLI